MSNEKKKVSVHYTGTFDNGEKFDSSYDRNEPLQFICMAGQMIPGFDAAVRDMEVGQTIDIRLTPKQAYGEHDESLVMKVPASQLPNSEDLPVGEMVSLYNGSGMGYFKALVVGIEDGIITFDANHPMAGKCLNFNITLLSAE